MKQFLFFQLALCTLKYVGCSEHCYIGAYRSDVGPWDSCSGFRQCERGYYCENGVKNMCPGGYYGASAGLYNSLCSGVCPPGYFCPPGSKSPLENKCGNASVYCPQGSAFPRIVPDGFYSIVEGQDDDDSEDLKSAIALCPKGFYCQNGNKYLCPAGTYGNMSGLSSSQCSGICPEGWFCPLGSTNKYSTPCIASSEWYCPAGSEHPLPTPVGYYALSSHISAGGGYGAAALCPKGSFCINGVRTLCAPGTYGSVTASTNASCSGYCLPGYFCPVGSTSPREHPCGAAHLYCPYASGAPKVVTSGHYTTGSNVNGNASLGDDELTRTGQALCEAGFYCMSDGMRAHKFSKLSPSLSQLISGIRRLCPAGYFGSSAGLVSPVCSGLCAAGYYCPAGSTSATLHACGDDAVICLEGAASPLAVQTGYYSGESSRIFSMLCKGSALQRIYALYGICVKPLIVSNNQISNIDGIVSDDVVYAVGGNSSTRQSQRK